MEKKEILTKNEIKRAADILRRDDGVGASDYIEQFSWILFLRIFEGVEEDLREIAEAKGEEYKYVIEKEYRWTSWAQKDWKDLDELMFFVNNELFPYLQGLKGTPQKRKVGDLFREFGNKIKSPVNLVDVIEIVNKIRPEDFQDTHLLSQVYEELLQQMGTEGGWSGEFYTPRPIIRFMIKIIGPKIGEKIYDPFGGSGGFLVESFKYLMEKHEGELDVNKWNVLQKSTFYVQEKKPLPFLIGNMNMILHGILTPNYVRQNSLAEDVHSVPEGKKKDIILTNPPFGGKEHKSVQNNFPVGVAATEALALQYVMRYVKTGGRVGIVLPEGQILFGGGAFQKIREELLEKFNLHTIVSLPQGVFAQMGAGVKTNLLFFEKTGPTKEIWYYELEGKFTKKQVIQDHHFDDALKKYKNREISENSWLVTIDEIKKKNFDISPKNPNKKDNEELPEPKILLDRISERDRIIENIISSLREYV